MTRAEILRMAESSGIRIIAGSLDGTPDALVQLVNSVIEIATIDDLVQADAWIFHAARDQREIVGVGIDG